MILFTIFLLRELIQLLLLKFFRHDEETQTVKQKAEADGNIRYYWESVDTNILNGSAIS